MMPDLKRLPILENERLRLQPIVSADVDDVFPLMMDPKVMAYWDVPEIQDPDRVAAQVRAWMAED